MADSEQLMQTCGKCESLDRVKFKVTKFKLGVSNVTKAPPFSKIQEAEKILYQASEIFEDLIKIMETKR